MKKLKLLMLTLLIFVFGISSVNAMTLKPTGDNSGKRGSNVTLYVTLNRSESEKTVSSVEAKFSFDSNVFELVSATAVRDTSKWLEFSKVTNGGTFSYGNIYYNDLIDSTSANFVEVTLKIKDDAAYGNSTINIGSVSATDENADGISISGGSHTVKVLSDVNTLTNLTVEGGTLEFNENTTTYNMTIDSTSTNIVATKKDSASTVSGVGNKSLKYGINTFKVTVTSESGIKKDYTLNITRPDNRNKVNTLSSLKLSKGDIKFNANTTSYKTTVEYDVSSIKVDATVTDEKASFVSGYGPREVKLKVGTNNIEIRVKAENESVKTYKIAVTRKPDPNDVRSDNNYLSELNLSEGTIEFDKTQLEYNVTVLNEIETIEVTAKTEDTKAKYKINAPKKLEVGENEITIVVTAENGSTREYKVIVERKAENEVISGNNKLSSLAVDGYQLNFNSEIYEYTLKIADEKSLIISYQQEDETSDVIINGNENLKNGSIITVNVTSEDGNTQVYKINIQKEEKDNLFMYIIIGGVVLLLLIIIIVIIANSKKKKNNDGNQNGNLNTIDSVNDLAINQNVMSQNTNMTYTQNQQPNVQNMQPNFNSQSMQNQNMGQNVSNQQMTQTSQNVSSESVQTNNGQNNNFF